MNACAVAAVPSIWKIIRGPRVRYATDGSVALAGRASATLSFLVGSIVNESSPSHDEDCLRLTDDGYICPQLKEHLNRLCLLYLRSLFAPDLREQTHDSAEPNHHDPQRARLPLGHSRPQSIPTPLCRHILPRPTPAPSLVSGQVPDDRLRVLAGSCVSRPLERGQVKPAERGAAAQDFIYEQ